MSMRIARPALLILYGLLLATVLLIPTEAAAQTTVKYVHTDVLGSVVAMTDASGTVVDGHREYEAYGQQLTPMVQDGPGYTGHVQDAATGLTYMQQRYYDPQLGVFLSVDPVMAYGNPVSQFHRYRYANNNPYKFTDPDGRQSWSNTGTANPWPAVQQACGGSNSCEQEVAGDLAKAEGGMLTSVGGGGFARGLLGRIFARESGVSLAQANKIHHVFSQSRHNLGGLAKSMGGEVKAFRAIEGATAKAVDVSKAGKFETVVKVGGEQVTVRGTVVNGQIKIGTAFIKPPPPPPPPPVRP